MINIDHKKLMKIGRAVYAGIDRNHLAIVASGVGFYAFLSIFPALISLISLYGLVVDPHQAQQQIESLGTMMPDEALAIIQGRIDNLLSTSQASLSLGTSIGILISMWSANKGTKYLFTGLEIAYGATNSRHFIKQNVITLAFTFAAIITMIITMVLVMVFPALVDVLHLPERIESLVAWLRWPLLLAIVVGMKVMIYRFAPDRRTPSFRLALPGAILSTVLWLLVSWGFSFYVSNFGDYGEMYGALSAVVVLLLWLDLTSFIILLGAQLNAMLEEFESV